MIMSFRKSDCQEIFENMFTGSNGRPFTQIAPKRDIVLRHLDSNESTALLQAMKNDLEEYYYKGILSFAEAISSIDRNLYSWATVKLYYSVFYFLRCSLACKGVAVVRAERILFYIRSRAGEHFFRCPDNTDHKGTMLTYRTLFQSSDMLLSNDIDSISTYEWLMKKREETNYKDISFHDPTPPDFWSQIANDLKSKSMNSLIQESVQDAGILCFQEDYAILSIPVRRLCLTIEDMVNEGISFAFTDERQETIRQLLVSLDSTMVNNILQLKKL